MALDPDFALAWAALAASYFPMIWVGHWSRDYVFNNMKQALDKALELDPALPDAHAFMGIYQYYWNFDVAAAGASYRRALELDPDNFYACFEYGLFLNRTGRPGEAMAMLRRAHELDPLNPEPLEGIAGVYSSTRQYEKALEYYLLNDELRHGSPGARSGIKLRILIQQGRYAEVAAEAEKAGNFWLQMRAEWARGNKEKVYAVRDSLRSTGELQQGEQERPFWSARFYAIMGEKEKALGLLEKAYDDTSISRMRLVYEPEFDFLRAEPRFKALMQKIGLTEVFDQYGQRIR